MLQGGGITLELTLVQFFRPRFSRYGFHRNRPSPEKLHYSVAEYPPGWGGGGGRLPKKDRYGCEASVKSRPGKISPRNLISGKKVPENLKTEQVFMKF